MNGVNCWALAALFLTGGCSHVQSPSGGAEPQESAPSTYSFDPQTLCPRVEEVLGAARDGFGEIRSKVQAGGRAVNVWSTSLRSEGAECQIVDLGGGSPVYLCSVALPGPQSALNWHASLQSAVLACLPAAQGWTGRSMEDRGGSITQLQAANGAPPFVFIRHFRNDRMLSAQNWMGAVSVGNESLPF